MQIIFNFSMGMTMIGGMPLVRLILRTANMDNQYEVIGDFAFEVNGIDALIGQLQQTKANILAKVAADGGAIMQPPTPDDAIQVNPAVVGENGDFTGEWMEGYRAGMHEANPTNPFEQGTPKALEWKDGFEYGRECKVDMEKDVGTIEGGLSPTRDTD